ncbi:MAG: DUF2169 domain-containing protein [Geobacteraceae bacterium]|nr:DUF2169 domain-containing protein [Geobacteraceae bacterium]
MDFINDTPFTAAPFVLTGTDGSDTLAVIVKGSWRITDAGALCLADEQVPLNLEPLYAGEPGLSSLILDPDLVPEKPGTDCVLLGHAWALRGKVTGLDVSFAVGPVRQQARVFGERIWQKALGAIAVSQPAPFEKIPLTWERAFGGQDASCLDPADHEYCLENPVGKGFVARKSLMNLDGLPLPNIENPRDLIVTPQQRPRPIGFGMVTPHWQPRLGYAGTYDDAWRRTMSPLPPADLDPRFYSAAAPGLVSPRHLTGNEQVLIEGAARQGRLQFALPGISPKATVRRRRGEEALLLRLDTVIVEPDEARLVLVWRGALNVHGQVHDVGAVKVEIDQI